MLLAAALLTGADRRAGISARRGVSVEADGVGQENRLVHGFHKVVRLAQFVNGFMHFQQFLCLEEFSTQ